MTPDTVISFFIGFFVGLILGATSEIRKKQLDRFENRFKPRGGGGANMKP